MPLTLLPASAAAFAPRAPPTVVLNRQVEPWLTTTLRRTNRVKRPLNSAPQHKRALVEVLSKPAALWTLCCLMLPQAPDGERRRDPNPLVEALFNYQLLHIEAYVVHVDLVYSHEIAFKLTQEAIDALVAFHQGVYAVDAAAAVTAEWADKPAHLAAWHDDFVQAVNRFVYRTGAHALEALEDDGAGELLEGRAEQVRNAIMALFVPLRPPPPPSPPPPQVLQHHALDHLPPSAILPSSAFPIQSAWWGLPGPGDADLHHPSAVTSMPEMPEMGERPEMLEMGEMAPESPASSGSTVSDGSVGWPLDYPDLWPIDHVSACTSAPLLPLSMPCDGGMAMDTSIPFGVGMGGHGFGGMGFFGMWEQAI